MLSLVSHTQPRLFVERVDAQYKRNAFAQVTSGPGRLLCLRKGSGKLGREKKAKFCAASATSCVRTRAVKRKGDATMEKRLGVEGVDAGEG